MHFAKFKKIIEFNLFKTFMKKKSYITAYSTGKIKQMNLYKVNKNIYKLLVIQRTTRLICQIKRLKKITEFLTTFNGHVSRNVYFESSKILFRLWVIFSVS